MIYTFESVGKLYGETGYGYVERPLRITNHIDIEALAEALAPEIVWTIYEIEPLLLLADLVRGPEFHADH